MYDFDGTMVAPPPTSRGSANSPPVQEESGFRARLRRFAIAWLLGAAVVIWPAWPTAAQERSVRRPAFERALTWRDFIRLRLSPWLLAEEMRQRIERGRSREHG